MDVESLGNIKLGHDQMVDESCHLVSMAYGAAGVKKEPFLRDASGKVLDKDLRADFMAHSVWERQWVAFFYNHILDADAPSCFNRNMSYVLRNSYARCSEGDEEDIPGALRGPGWELHAFSVHGGWGLSQGVCRFHEEGGGCACGEMA